MAEIDYESIKTEYLTQDVSFHELARKYGINQSSISRKALKDHWKDEKEQLRIYKHKESTKRTIDAQIDIAARCMRTIANLTDKIEQASEIVAIDDTKSQRDIIAMIRELNDMGAFVFEGAVNKTITVEFIGMDDDYGV